MPASRAIGGPDQEEAKIINRRRRLEGQGRALQTMVNEDRNCVEVMPL